MTGNVKLFLLIQFLLFFFNAFSPAPNILTISSTSKTHPPQVPPLTFCNAAQSRVSSGRSLSFLRVKLGILLSKTSAPSLALKELSLVPIKSTVPSSLFRSITIFIRSPSFNFDIGPPARASGLTCPIQAPVETPEKRAADLRAATRAP